MENEDWVEEFLVYSLLGEEYAMPLLQVREIRGYTRPTCIAGTPACIKGVLNLRGDMLPVFDLRIVLGAKEVKYDEKTIIVVLDFGDRVVALVVDAVVDVVELTKSNVKTPATFGGFSGSEHLDGIASLDKRMLILLNLKSLLSAESLASRT